MFLASRYSKLDIMLDFDDLFWYMCLAIRHHTMHLEVVTHCTWKYMGKYMCVVLKVHML